MAERIGQPLMPWQRLVADVGGELLPNGRPAYRTVIVTVPRQSGKTLLTLCWEVQRAIGWDGPQRIAYSAQTGNDARKKLIEDQVPLLERQKKALGILRILRGMGNEAVEFRTGSRIVLLASAEDSGHGKTLDLAVKDEFFADYDDRRDQAIVPAMATKAAGQVLTLSTMGTSLSLPLNRAVEMGRAAVESDTHSGVAYFEWSAPPGADPDDPEVWWSCMPALGWTITEEVVAHARATMSDGEFRRAFLNQQMGAPEQAIPQADWAACADKDAQRPAQPVFAIDTNPERTRSAVVVGGLRPDGLPQVMVVESQDGTGWLAPKLADLKAKHSGARFLVLPNGPAGSVITEAAALGVVLEPVTQQQYGHACGLFHDLALTHRMRHRPDLALDSALAGAAKRTSGDTWTWNRKSSSVDISPLVAATVALWAAHTASTTSIYEMRGLSG